MVKEDLIERSPVRKFEKLLGGGVKAGEIGVIASKKGLGKTSILVQLAIDTLLQGKTVIHVSFNQQADYVATWYENIFAEQAARKNLNKVAEVKAELMARRIVLNFNQETVHTEHVIRTIKALGDSGIKADSIIIDGFDFDKATDTCVKDMKTFAAETGCSVWYSANIELEGGGLPEKYKAFAEDMDVILFLSPESDGIHIKALKEHENRDVNVYLKLDVKTLLLAEK